MLPIFSYGVAAAAFIALLLLLIVSRQSGRIGFYLQIACGFSILWSICAIWAQQSVVFSGLTETTRLLAWAVFLHMLVNAPLSTAVVDTGVQGNTDGLRSNGPKLLWFIALLAVSQLAFTASFLSLNPPPLTLHILLPCIWISSAIVGLVYLESFYRSTAPEKRRAIKPLCLGLAGVFILDFLVFTDTLLFKRINLSLIHI